MGGSNPAGRSRFRGIRAASASGGGSGVYPKELCRRGSLAALALIVDSESDSAPTDAALRQFEKVKAEVDQYMKRWSDIRQTDLPSLERAVEQQGIKPIAYN